jgi:hypothetical protein
MVSKYHSNRTESHRVSILLGVIRLRTPHTTDILIALNRPETSEALRPATADSVVADFTAMLKTFAVNSFELFESGGE